MRLRSATGSSMPSSRRPSMARRTPRTWPAHRCPWAAAASSRYSARVFIGASAAQAFPGAVQGCGRRASMKAKMVMSSARATSAPSRMTVLMVSGSAAAKQPQLICMPRAYHGGKESQHDQGDERGPNAESPADEQQKTEPDFREGQCVGDPLDAPRWENPIGIHLQCKKRKGHSQRRTRTHSHGQFGVAGIDEDTGQDEAADPDDGAA